MKYLDEYTRQYVEQGKEALAQSVTGTANEFVNNYFDKFDYRSNLVILLFGNVQSGKTSQMFGVAAAAADKGFPYFLLVTTDNKLLQQQTYERAVNDLPGFVVCDESEEEKFRECKEHPALIVLKKNVRVLRNWRNILKNSNRLKGNPLFIIDDESDAASLNTKVNEDDVSSINETLSDIKNDASSSIYLQVTGTPQALFLQSESSGSKPEFTHYFEPGEGYLGGDFFFPLQGKPSFVVFVDNENPIEVAKKVVIRHLVVSAQVLLSGDKVSNCLVHPGVKQIAHKEYKIEIEKGLTWWTSNHGGDLERAVAEEYDSIHPVKTAKKSMGDILRKVKEMLENQQYNIVTLNGRSSDGSDEYASGCNFIVGGLSLGRGVTFDQLNTFYYTRTSKRHQADTMWQHSRMFGYDRDPGLISMYISHELYKLFSEINETNNSIIAQIISNHNAVISYPQGLSPTRKNVLNMSLLNIIPGGANRFPSSPRNESYQDICDLLADYNGSEPPIPINLKLMIKILKHVSADDMNIDAYAKMLESAQNENPLTQGMLLVRRHRNITKNSGALLSENDWKATNRYATQFVLTMYQVDGKKEQGWDGNPLWIPNIKLPKSKDFYYISDDTETLDKQ